MNLYGIMVKRNGYWEMLDEHLYELDVVEKDFQYLTENAPYSRLKKETKIVKVTDEIG